MKSFNFLKFIEIALITSTDSKLYLKNNVSLYSIRPNNLCFSSCCLLLVPFTRLLGCHGDVFILTSNSFSVFKVEHNHGLLPLEWVLIWTKRSNYGKLLELSALSQWFSTFIQNSQGHFKIATLMMDLIVSQSFFKHKSS